MISTSLGYMHSLGFLDIMAWVERAGARQY